VYREFDDVDSIIQLLADADIVVYSTPVYVLGMSSLLKLLLERFYAYARVGQFALSQSGLFFHDIPRAICSKPFVTLVCCDSFETRTTKNCEDYFRAFALFHDAKWLCHLVRDSGRLLLIENDLLVVRKQQTFDAFEQVGNDLGRLGVVRRASRNGATRELIPIPGFRYVKNLKFVKRAVLKQALAVSRTFPSCDLTAPQPIERRCVSWTSQVDELPHHSRNPRAG